MLNRPLAHYCVGCGARLEAIEAAQAVGAASASAWRHASTPSAPLSVAMRLLEANIFPGFGRRQDTSASIPASRFYPTDSAFHIRLRLFNLDQTRTHSHRLFAHYFRPSGRLHASRERPELVVAAAGKAEVETKLFGLRIAGTDVVNYPGIWRVGVYLDEAKLVELPFAVISE